MRDPEGQRGEDQRHHHQTEQAQKDPASRIGAVVHQPQDLRMHRWIGCGQAMGAEAKEGAHEQPEQHFALQCQAARGGGSRIPAVKPRTDCFVVTVHTCIPHVAPIAPVIPTTSPPPHSTPHRTDNGRTV